MIFLKTGACAVRRPSGTVDEEEVEGGLLGCSSRDADSQISSCIPPLSTMRYRIYPKPWLLSPRPSNAARLSRPGHGHPRILGGTKRVNIPSGKRSFFSVVCLYWYLHLNI